MSLESEEKNETAKAAAKKGAIWTFRAILVSVVFSVLYFAEL